MDSRPLHSTAPGKLALLGLGSGVALGATDLVGLRLMGMRVVLDGQDFTLMTMAVVTLTFAALGFSIGWLVETRRQVQGQVEVIQGQMTALRHSQAELVEKERMASLGHLAAGVAHEVRNALAVIRSAAGLLGEGPLGDDPDSARSIQFLGEETHRLDRFVRSLLGLARPVEVRQEAVDLEEVLDRARVLGQVDGETRSVTIEVAAFERPVRTDPELLARALAPLVSNAMLHAAGRLQLEAAGGPEHWWIDVRDDGAGVPPERQDAVFQPFETERAGGTGLGLPMARRVAAALGATVHYRSGAGLGPDGGGACFRLEREEQ